MPDSSEPLPAPPPQTEELEDLHFSNEEYRLLVEQCLAGDTPATETLYRALWLRGSCQIRHFVRRQDLAEDVVATVLNRLLGPAPSGILRTLEQYDASKPLTPWFDSIVAKKAIDLLRSEGRRRQREQIAASRLPRETEGGVRRIDHRDQVRHAMRNLTTDERVLLEHWMNGWDFKSMGAVFGIPAGTVGSRLTAIKLKIKRDIDGEL